VTGGRDADPTGPIRASIRRITAQRDQARAAAGRALVTSEQVQAALREQAGRLRAAAEEIAEAVRTADRAAAGARADAAADARGAGLPEDRIDAAAAAAGLPFERTRAGLQAQADVIEQALGQLAEMTGTVVQQVADGRALVAASLQSMDAALRAQVALLVELERAERQRLIERAKRAR